MVPERARLILKAVASKEDVEELLKSHRTWVGLCVCVCVCVCGAVWVGLCGWGCVGGAVWVGLC